MFLFWNVFDFLELSHRHRHVDTHTLSLLNKRNLFSFYICYRPYISVSKPSLILYFTINHNFPNPKSKRTHTHILLVSTCKQSPAHMRYRDTDPFRAKRGKESTGLREVRARDFFEASVVPLFVFLRTLEFPKMVEFLRWKLEGKQRGRKGKVIGLQFALVFF